MPSIVSLGCACWWKLLEILPFLDNACRLLNIICRVMGLPDDNNVNTVRIA